MSDGSADDFSKVVDEEFCTDIEPTIDGNKNVVLEETCTQPCPGNNSKTEFILLAIPYQDHGEGVAYVSPR